MNIFILDTEHTKSALYYVDKHVVKMPLETAQMLCTAIANNGIQTPYKPTHKNHPCTLWLNESLDNFYWLCDLGIAICKEYTFRYNKIHKCEAVIEWCRKNPPTTSALGLTKQALAMPDSCKISEDVVLCYRNYYIKEKGHLHSWKNRQKPEWINN